MTDFGKETYFAHDITHGWRRGLNSAGAPRLRSRQMCFESQLSPTPPPNPGLSLIAYCLLLIAYRLLLIAYRLLLQLRVFQIETGGVLIGLGQGQHFGFAIELAEEREAYRSAGATDAVVVPVVFYRRLRGVGSAEAIGQNQRGITREVRRHQLLAGSGRNNH